MVFGGDYHRRPRERARWEPALAADDDLGARLPLQLLLRVAARAEDEADEGVAGVLLDRHRNLGDALAVLEPHGTHAVRERLHGHHLLHQRQPLLLQALAEAEVARVGAAAGAIVDWLRRRRPPALHRHPLALVGIVALMHAAVFQAGHRLTQNERGGFRCGKNQDRKRVRGYANATRSMHGVIVETAPNDLFLQSILE